MWSLANPTRFLELADRLIPWLAGLTFLLLGIGLYLSFFVAPPDYQQGETVKIMFVHVPSAWLAMFGYTLIAIASIGSLIWRHPLADVAAKTAAPIGATFCFLALVTGSLWGKPMWGTYWVWDARLTSMLVLFLLYLGLIALWQSIEEPGRAGRAAAILALVGFVNVPIIKFSVEWWNTLHQPASIFRMGGPTIDPSLLTPLFVMAVGLHPAVRAVAPHRHARRDLAPPRAGASPGACRARRFRLRPNPAAHARSRSPRGIHLGRLCRDLHRRGRARRVHRAGRPKAAAAARRSRAAGHQAALGQAGRRAASRVKRSPGRGSRSHDRCSHAHSGSAGGSPFRC